MSITVIFEEPNREDYHNTPDCQPRKRGDGCYYGDCLDWDCYFRELKTYNRRKKKIEEKDGGLYKDALAYMVDVMDDYDGYDVNDAKELKKLIDKMVKFAKRKLKESEK